MTVFFSDFGTQILSKPEVVSEFYNFCISLFYNLCNPFKHDLRCASLCGVEFVFKKDRREKDGAVEVKFERVDQTSNFCDDIGIKRQG